MWGVMVAVLNFVPYLGALTGIICMTLGAVLSFDSVGYALLFPLSYLVLATLEGNFITPLVMGRSLTLNPVLVLLSLTFWGWMWGIVGVILAVPDPGGLQDFLQPYRTDGAAGRIHQLRNFVALTESRRPAITSCGAPRHALRVRG